MSRFVPVSPDLLEDILHTKATTRRTNMLSARMQEYDEAMQEIISNPAQVVGSVVPDGVTTRGELL